MRQFKALFKREFLGYFRSPVAYVFIVIFLLACTGSTFFIGQLYKSNQASLLPFFSFLPWIQMVMVPAIGMSLWAEERQTGTIELLLTLPVSISEAVLAKFAAAWLFIIINLLLTFPLPLTVSYLGQPDWGVIFASYIGGILTGGTFLSISAMASALSKNQVIAFILGVLICFILLLLGWGIFTDILASVFPVALVDSFALLGVMPHFNTILRGILDSRDIVYFLTVISCALVFNGMILNSKKAA